MAKRADLEAVIFDFNGTLFRDARFHDAAWSAFGAVHGLSVTAADIENHVIGFANEEILKYFFNRPLTEGEIDRYSREKERLYRDRCLAEPEACQLAPGAETFLDFVQRLGLKRTIATASIIENVRFFFSTFALDRWFVFDDIIYDDGELKGKPFPDMFLAAARALDTEIECCMIIEDSTGGIEAANRAGAGHVVAILPSESRAKIEGVAGIDEIVSDFSEIDKTRLCTASHK